MQWEIIKDRFSKNFSDYANYFSTSNRQITAFSVVMLINFPLYWVDNF